MFIGQHPCSLNSDLSLLFPANFKELAVDEVYITQGFDRNLLILTTRTFEAIYQHLSSLNIADPTVRLLFRLVFGSASLLETDDAGRFLIPQRLAEFADLKEKIIILGQGDFCEVWSQDHWQEQEVQLLDVDNNSKRFSALVLTI